MSNITKCSRCKKRLRNNGEGWNITVERGRIVGHLCPHCQTDEETAEAQINEATLDYSLTDDGLLAASAKYELVEP